MLAPPKVISLELNELNFDFVRRYCSHGKLPGFARLLRKHPIFQTISERDYPNLEPWIQWPTVYSGKSFAEHGVFRLGDITGASHEQIWEVLERRGVTVGAVSPMNAANRCVSPAFFIPDPWTVTKVSGSTSLRRLYGIIRELVNTNSNGKRSLPQLALQLLPYVLRYSSASSVPQYASILRHAARNQWGRAIFLDRFLADLFLKLNKQTKPQFSSLFLNAGAHIQHHYMFDSQVYDGPNRNPSWYSNMREAGIDPLLTVYQCYDHIVTEFLNQADTRLLITTGLSQYPNNRCIYQYRFKNHLESLKKLGIERAEVVPRMSRDFLLTFRDDTAASAAEASLRSVTLDKGPMFTVENRGSSLFCQIGFFGEIKAFEYVDLGGRTMDLSNDVVLVSIENGLHRTEGFHVDTAIAVGEAPEATTIELKDVFFKMRSAFDGSTNSPVATARAHHSTGARASVS